MLNKMLTETTRRILRIRQVEERVGFKKANIYRLMREKQFPQHHRIGLRAVGWDSQEIEAWVNERLQRPQQA